MDQPCGSEACERPRPHRVEPGRGLCGPCRDRLRATLATLRELHGASAEALTHARPRTPERVSGGQRGDIVLDEGVLGVRAEILATLAHWAAVVRTSAAGPGGGSAAVPERQVADLVAHLDGGLDQFAADPLACHLAADLTDLVERVAAVLDPGARAVREIGRCVRAGCGEPVLARLSSGDGPAGVRCAAGHAWAPGEWLRLAAGLHPAVGRPA